MAKNGSARTPAVPSVEMVQPQDGTGNLSKQHRDDLVRKLGAIKNFLEASKDTNAVQLLRFAAEVEKEVCTKKYGLVFEEHKERVDVELEHNLPVLTEDKKRFIDNGGEVNFLIEGDNLAALKLLEKTHRGKIDLIYIDPPYNTGNKDFVYNDSYVDATDTFRHSKWLSFMKKRLEIARRLLSAKGLIFISIDDREQAALRLLCDSEFSEENFVNQICVKMSEATGVKMTHTKQRLPKLKEYVLVYSRNGDIDIRPIRVQKEKWDDEYNIFCDGISEQDICELKSIRDKEVRTKAEMDKCDRIMQKIKYKTVSAAMRDFAVSKSDDETKFKIDNAWRIVRTVAMAGGGKKIADQKRKDSGLSSFVIETKEKKLYFIKGDYSKDSAQPRIKLLFADDYLTYNPCDFWQDIKTTGLEAEGGVTFLNGKKPLKLIERIVGMIGENATILDFFAGSGTTGHAVMNLNAKDGGKRKFILVTNNENEICEKVTYERLKRVIEKEDYAARLKYYKIGYVPIDEKVYYEYANDLLKHIRELVELENAVDFSKDKVVAIALTDTELEKLAGNDKRLEACKAVYVGHDVLISSAIKATLKKHGVKVNIIPQYYYPELEG